jgi:hypothetical protein
VPGTTSVAKSQVPCTEPSAALGSVQLGPAAPLTVIDILAGCGPVAGIDAAVKVGAALAILAANASTAARIDFFIIVP